MILSFHDSTTEDIFHGIVSKKALRIPKDVWSAARRKLDLLNAAHTLEDLKAPAGNHLEALKGKDRGLYSIRINDQYRLKFDWSGHDAADIEITDYH